MRLSPKQAGYLVAVVLLSLGIFILLECDHRKHTVVIDTPDPTTWINNGGDIVTSIAADPAYFEKMRSHLIDSLAKVYNTKPKRVVEYITVTDHGETNLPPSGPVIVYVDSSKKEDCPPRVANLAQAFASPYYTAFVQIGDSSYLHLQSFDTLTALWKKVKQGNIFNRETLLQLDLSHANPDLRIQGVQAYRAPTPKVKKWSIGLQLGYGAHYDGAQAKTGPYVGVGLTRSLIRF